MSWEILTGDALEVLRAMPNNSFDGLLSDPPYGYSFMNKKWDISVPSVEVWREALRVLKPGAPLLAFSGTRTYHRTVVAIEDAGFEIRDCIAWMYGSGFPKSLAVDKAIDAANGDERPVVGEWHMPGRGKRSAEQKYGLTNDSGVVASAASAASEAWSGYGTALKPAFEPCVLARKPLEGTMAANVAKWGVGGLAIDACRVETEDHIAPFGSPKKSVGGILNGTSAPREQFIQDSVGRWPANLILDEDAAALLDAQSGDRPGMSGGGVHAIDYAGGMFGAIDSAGTARGDHGGASRFFYVAKADRVEREFGCEALPLKSAGEATDREDGTAAMECPRTGANRTGGARNHHPTVKPIALAKWLATLILPPPRSGSSRRLLVPFAGSGSEMIGAIRAGWDEVVGIEREPEYVAIAEARIRRWLEVAERVEDVKKPAPADERQVSLFGRTG